MEALNFRSLIIFSAFLRVLLIVYGEWQDTHMEVRYTDVDYLVFSDAAALVVAGKSSYKRSTYRYSPLIAYILAPNSFIHRSWGKFLFSASDLLVGYFIRSILKLRGVPENLSIYSVIVWLFNPFTFTIGTRGNCEPIICAIILWVILCIMRGNIFQGDVWYGLVVHMRIYPIIYAIPIILILDPNHYRPGDNSSVLCVVFLSVATNTTMEQNEAQMGRQALLQIMNHADPSFRGQIQPPWILLNSTAVWSLD
ncbi:hypothetical protein R6Q59_013270 [Mikania micrantha]|uniref:GPI mannosyltransferase 1 n=1 Tax=Mikania micrantha TaxID=192012 RepID=A0A5N6LNT0_9ASTR|nr:hypothetical protein E3N88_40860 [Mikania micrantha]